MMVIIPRMIWEIENSRYIFVARSCAIRILVGVLAFIFSGGLIEGGGITWRFFSLDYHLSTMRKSTGGSM